MTHKEKAQAYFREGYNCSQAVLLAFSDELGLDKDTAAMLASSFGGGMGRLREVCGAVSAMFMVVGLKRGYADPKDRGAKAKHYALIQEMAKEFRDLNGSIVCRELLGTGKADSGPTPSERTPEYYKKRPCVELVGEAAEIAERHFLKEE